MAVQTNLVPQDDYAVDDSDTQVSHYNTLGIVAFLGVLGVAGYYAYTHYFKPASTTKVAKKTTKPAPVPAHKSTPTKMYSIKAPDGHIYTGESYDAVVNAAGGYYNHTKWTPGHYVNGHFVATPKSVRKPSRKSTPATHPYVPPTTYSSSPAYGQLLEQGDSGSGVRTLQTNLWKLGYNAPSNIDGIFGPKTKQAVMAFQRAAHIQVDGIVGQQTYGALATRLSGRGTTSAPTSSGGCTLLQQGSSGPAVLKLQQALFQLGYNAPSNQDGIFGPKTMQALMAFQRAAHIQVDGIARRQTYTALNARFAALKAEFGSKAVVYTFSC